MKVVLGTANFNQNYGFKKKKIGNINQIRNILNFSKKSKINLIDTAVSYNFSNKFLKKINLKNFGIITKISLPERKKLHFIRRLEIFLKKKLHLFGIKKFESILLHNVYDLKSEIGRKFLNEFLKLKKKRLTKNLGISIYEPKDFKFVIKKFKPDIIQLPLNIFDQRFLKDKFLENLKKNKIKIQVRSIFLQGKFFKNKKKKENLKVIKNFNLWCLKKNISNVEACLMFIKSQKEVDLLTIGVENINQLKQNLAILKKNNKINLKTFSIKNKKIIDPRKW